VALGWGEPLVPWWGPPRFRRHPHWAGWGGPRVVNNVVVEHKTVINIKDINIYQNAGVRDAVVAVDRDHFGHRSGKEVRFARMKPDKLSPLHGDVPVKPDRSSLVAEERAGKRPPRQVRERPVVAAREPKLDPTPELKASRRSKLKLPQSEEHGAPEAMPAARVVQPERTGRRIKASERPPFGKGGEAEREIPPPAPRFEKPEKQRELGTRVERKPGMPSERDIKKTQREFGAPEGLERTKPDRGGTSGRYEKPARPARDLPGEPANRVYRQRFELPQSMPHAYERAEPAQSQSVREGRAPRQERSGSGPTERESLRGR
jgi:hypothetical protein